MFTLDGTDTTWLIYADYLDDNGSYRQTELVREEVLEENNYWYCLYSYGSRVGVDGNVGDDNIAGVGYNTAIVGTLALGDGNVGDFVHHVGGDDCY